MTNEDDYEDLFFTGMDDFASLPFLTPFLDNRTVVPLGGVIDPENPIDPGSTSDYVLRCRADGPSPILAWLRDGEEVDDTDPRITITDVVTTTTRTMQDLRITNFQQSDAGVYQCISRNGDDGVDVVTSVPLRLDTGQWTSNMPLLAMVSNSHLLELTIY